MTEYRQRFGSEVWHFCRNCSRYPVSEEVEEQRRREPTTGRLCQECTSKRERGVCSDPDPLA